jgi:hypothetical protein
MLGRTNATTDPSATVQLAESVWDLCTGSGLLDNSAAKSRGLASELLTHLTRGPVAVPLQAPLTVVSLDELSADRSRLFGM